MPGFLLHEGSVVFCAHGGQARPSAPNARVLIFKNPIVMMPAPDTIAGCAFNVSGSPSPCVTATWSTAATRVKSNNQPVLLSDSQATCAPNSTPLTINKTQTKVRGI